MSDDPRLIASGLSDLLPMVRTGDPLSHVSAIIRSLCVRMGHFEGGDVAAMDPDEARELQTRWQLGSAFEDAVVASLRNRYIKAHPDRYAFLGELSADGLIGTPDLMDVTDWAVIEIKLTWMSNRHDPTSTKFWKYWVQVKAYCYMAHSFVGRLHVCHLNGDYRGSGPIYNVWECKFTRRDLDENWRMLLSHAELMKREGA